MRESLKDPARLHHILEALLGFYRQKLKIKMKNFNSLLVAGVMAICLTASLMLSSCIGGGDDDEENTSQQGFKVETGRSYDVKGHIAKVEGKVDVDYSMLADLEFGILYSTKEDVSFDDCEGVVPAKTLKDKTFNVTLSNLEHATKYYYCTYAQIGKISICGEVKSFSTISNCCSTSISRVYDINGDNVTVEYSASYSSSSTAEHGVLLSKSQELTIDAMMQEGKGTSISGGTDFRYKFTELDPDTKYYCCSYVKVDGHYLYSQVKSFSTSKYMSVDLGLSVKWATCNIGAEKPEDYGDYFAWGETSPKSKYDWETYKLCNGSSITMTKYCTSSDSDYGIVDNKTTLDLSDDAAHVNWGGSWRMPTRAEQDELCNNCTWAWTTMNGVNGYKVTSKKNGNFIFLPAAGIRYDSALNFVGSDGYYWSSSLYTGSYLAYYLFFGSGNVNWDYNYRCYGLSVRPVCQ